MSALSAFVTPFAKQWAAIYAAGREMQVLARAARLLAENSGDPADAEFASVLEGQARRFGESLPGPL